MKTRVYISGPIAGDEHHLEKFNAAQFKLEDKGYSVINPAVATLFLPEDLDYEEFMQIDLAMLETCDVIFMLKGWQQSRGANREYGYALAKGMKIICQM